MEPEKNNLENATVGGLHDEGIDILEGTRSAEDNEFGSPELAAAREGGKNALENESETSSESPEALEPVSGKPITPLSKSTPAPEPAPEPVKPISVQTPPVTSIPKPAPKPEEPVALKNDPSIKPLRTFKTDAEEAVRYQNISAAQIALAEQKRRETQGTPIEYDDGKKTSPLFLVIISALIIILLGGGAYYWLTIKEQGTKDSTIPSQLTVQTIVPYTRVATITLNQGENPLDTISSALGQTSINIGEVFALIPIPTGTTTAIASPSTVFAKTKMPARLVRSLAPQYMIGMYYSNHSAPFIILKNTFFQNAYAGMLEWETDMRNDLIGLIRTTYPNETSISVNSDVFEDSVVSNIDARILKGSDGQPILAYAFPDQSTVVIATDIETLQYLLNKLLAVRVIQ